MAQASVQLYSLGSHFSKNMDASLARLAEIGLRYVEAFDFVDRPSAIRAALDAAGMESPTAHAPLLTDALWTPDGSIPTPPMEIVFEAAASIGIERVIDPYVDPERWLTKAGVEDIADRINAAAVIAAGFGLTVGYHNHAQEFVAQIGSQTAYEHFVSLTDDRVGMELDLYWALAGGQDVPSLIARLGSRLVAIHVKDGIVPEVNPFAPGAPAFASSDLDQRVPGEGRVPLAESLKAAIALQYAVIEYDNPPGDVFEDVAESYKFLIDGGFVEAPTSSAVAPQSDHHHDPTFRSAGRWNANP